MPGHDPPNDVSSSLGAPREVRAPADVAGELGVSSSGLRRLALIYERVHGDLPRDPRLGRMWPTEAIERLALAREEVQAARAVSIEAALAALRRSAGVEPSPPVQRTPTPPEPSEALLEELRLLRGAVEGMSNRLESLERENRELRESVEAKAPAKPRQLPEAPDQADPGEASPTDPKDAEGFAEGLSSGDENQAVENLTPDQVETHSARPGRPERGLWRRVRRLLGRGDRLPSRSAKPAGGALRPV